MLAPNACTDTLEDGSDNDQPLSYGDQVVAILDIKATHPPPLPVASQHARATAKAVLVHTLNIHPMERKQAHNFALAMPLVATSITKWVEQQLASHRKEHTVKTALCMALNPSKPGTWACKRSGCSIGHMYVVKGLALHVRMHPFTRSEVEDAYDNLFYYATRYYSSPTSLGGSRQHPRDGSHMQAADALLSFQSGARVFGV